MYYFPNYEGEALVHIVSRHRYKHYKLRKRFKRRAAIEPIIGHLKNDCRLGRNYLSGIEGNEINSILTACGLNIRKLLKAIYLYLIKFISYFDKIIKFKDKILLLQG